ncbi:cation-transporting P-type ATPase [Paremcibacter congregatus]|uniref:cation-translocating P-type ATPase n=1 Tax=Paremcibacter congregatus TaxID=2043170 RepID=UPI0030EC0509
MQKSGSYHAQTADAVTCLFNVTTATGLSAEDVEQRRAQYGPNRLGRHKQKSALAILADQFSNILAALLIGAAAISFAFQDTAEGLAILVVIALNTAIGYWAESKAIRSMAALRKMGRARTQVRREGKSVAIPDEDIVPGDIIILEAGDIVTADTRIIECHSLQSNESLLTGEAIPVDKKAAPVPVETNLYERHNMLFKGTSITRGSCTGVCVATGRATELGQIADLAQKATAATSPLEYRLQKLSAQLAYAVLVLMTLLTLIGLGTGRELLVMIKTGIALAVAAIPEGLPIVATMALARGMWRLARKNALIEQLSAVETLGAVNIIFTDKTGTLTKNKMKVIDFILPSDGGSPAAPVSAKQRALRVCALCTSGPDPRRLTDPMEKALVEAAEQAGVFAKQLLNALPRVREISFDPDVRMMATLHQQEKKILYLIKGAPEAILAKATKIAGDGHDPPLTAKDKAQWLSRTGNLAQHGLRILALAEKTTAKTDAPVFEDLTFLGLLSLEDPPRKDAAAAVKAAQEAGIRVIMVTGDNMVTGSAIARAVGIEGAGPGAAQEGTALAKGNLTPSAQAQLLKTSVFARMSPSEKLNLIDLHQKNGAVVAMTGDGVNDAPALKKADVGIAMGLRGTEVAKQAAEMILKDDAFASIVIAIQQGRVIYANIRKFVIYLLSCNLSEVLVVTTCLLAGFPLPLLPLQILFLNLVTDVFPALALGFGQGDAEILKRPPRARSAALIEPRHWQAIITYAIIMTLSVVGAFLWAHKHPDYSADGANSIAFLSLALGQLWHVFNMRSRRAALLKNQVMQNPYVWGAIGICLGLLAAALYWPLLATVLHLEIPDQKGWLVVLLASLIPLLLGQIFKFTPPSRS